MLLKWKIFSENPDICPENRTKKPNRTCPFRNSNNDSMIILVKLQAGRIGFGFRKPKAGMDLIEHGKSPMCVKTFVPLTPKVLTGLEGLVEAQSVGPVYG